ncbi:MAG: saccharopine dehydrogenase NADP-binding domain-containing protein [Candidatus Bathyarchaeota archaeon]|jgi:saccharopine dehydrogenase-like NADP-dependent oxidoreductase
MKVLIIGCGEQGTGVAKYLVEKPDIDMVSLADIDIRKADSLAEDLKTSKVSTHRVNAANVEEILRVAKGVDVIVNAVVPRFNLPIMEAALRLKSNYVDMASGPPYVIDEQLGQTEGWNEAGLTALINTGISPGVTNVLVSRAVDQLDSVEKVYIRSATKILPGTRVYEGKELFLETWSPETMWQDFMEPPVVFEDGKWKTVPLFGGEEIYTFPEPLGPCTVVYHVHEEVFTLPRFINGLEKVDMKVGWEPTMFIAKAFMDLGLFGEKSIDVDGVKVTPQKVFLKLTKPIPTKEELIERIEAEKVLEIVGSTVVEVRGEKAGVATTYRYSPAAPSMTISKAYRKYGRSFLERPGVVSTSCAIFTHMLCSGRIETRGVVPPEGLSKREREDFLNELAKEGFLYKETIERQLS